jgi:hypothetical protein
LAGAGNFGKYHTERGLTYVTIDLSGHMVSRILSIVNDLSRC